MRLLYVATDVFSKGGIPRYARYQIRALQEIIGKENVIVYSFNSPDPSVAFEDSFFVHYIQGDLTVVDKIVFLKKCLSAVNKYKIDVMLFNHVQLSIIGYIAKKLYGIKYITNVYGLEIWTDIKKRSIIGLKNSDLILGDCNFILNYVEKNLNIERDKLRLLYDPVDVDRFKPIKVPDEIYEKYKIPRDKFIIMTTGRLDRYKGFGLVIETLPDLPDDVYYIIVGDGRDRKDLENLAKEKKVDNRVIFAGRVPEEDLVPLYNVCDVFVLVSKFGYGEGEGLPLTLIEAGACEKPLICGNEDGSVDAVEDGVNGFIISPQSNQLYEKIKILYKDREKLRNMGLKSRERVLKNFEYKIFKHIIADYLEKL